MGHPSKPQAKMQWSGSFICASDVAHEAKVGVGKRPEFISLIEITDEASMYPFFVLCPMQTPYELQDQETGDCLHVSSPVFGGISIYLLGPGTVLFGAI